MLGSCLLVPVVKPGFGHAFAETALFYKILFQRSDLLVEQAVGLVNEAESDVGDDFGGTGFDEFAVCQSERLGPFGRWCDRPFGESAGENGRSHQRQPQPFDRRAILHSFRETE
jgi:hypothetical protein